MPPKNKPLTIYLDDSTLKMFEDLREWIGKKEGGETISDSFIGRSLIEEKHREYVDKQNNRARITTLVEQVAMLTTEIKRLSELIEKKE